MDLFIIETYLINFFQRLSTYLQIIQLLLLLQLILTLLRKKMKKNSLQKLNKNDSKAVNKIIKPPSTQIKRAVILPQIRKKPTTLPQKVKLLETKIENLQTSNPIQQQILLQMKQIKDELNELKRNFKISKENHFETNRFINEQNIQNQKQNVRQIQHPIKSNVVSNNISNGNNNNVSQQHSVAFDKIINLSKKQLLPMNKIQPFLKDYKLEGNEIAPYYLGYNKKTMKPVIVKYADKPMDYQIQIYHKLWRNIVKSRWPCINKIYDIKQTEVNLMILDRNTTGIMNLPYNQVLVDIIKIMEFFHENGYLYRNISPQHFMLNQEQKLVIIDFKNVKRFIDHKGNRIQVIDKEYNQGIFGSNNQLKGASEGRKDDLQSLGYLALFLLSGSLPWQGMTRQQMIKSRSSLSLQNLYKSFGSWLEYMIIVHKMQTGQKPDYNKLMSLFGSS